MPEKVLIVSSAEQDAERLARLFRNFGMDAQTVGYASKARRKLLECDFDLIVINAPLSDEFGTEFAVNAAERTYAGILLFVKAELFAATLEKAEKYGVFVLEKPLQTPMPETVRLLRAVAFRLRLVRRENEKLQKKLADTRSIERAKLALIQYEGYSEEEAHKYIEKRAMDQRLSRVDVAGEILAKYRD